MKYFDHRNPDTAPFSVSISSSKINKKCLLYELRKSIFDKSMKVDLCLHPENVEVYRENRTLLLGCRGCTYYEVRSYPKIIDGDML